MTGEPLSVAIGAIAALWSVTVLVAIAGARLRTCSRLSHWIEPVR
jgi:hypothetical protein